MSGRPALRTGRPRPRLSEGRSEAEFTAASKAPCSLSLGLSFPLSREPCTKVGATTLVDLSNRTGRRERGAG